MLHEARSNTWFGGVFHPIQHTPQGLYRPEVGAWINDAGDLLGMIAAPPGHGSRALQHALQAALRRDRLRCPSRLAVRDDRLRARLRQSTDLPIDPLGPARFDSVVGAALERLAGREASHRPVACQVTHALARADMISVTPDALSDISAAALPSAYLTADIGLRKLASMQAGDRVLIHAATGGVGLAAVALAQRT